MSFSILRNVLVRDLKQTTWRHFTKGKLPSSELDPFEDSKKKCHYNLTTFTFSYKQL